MVFSAKAELRLAGRQARYGLVIPLIVHRTPKAGQRPERGPPARFEWGVKHSGLIVCKRRHGLPCGRWGPERGPLARLEWAVKHSGLKVCNRQHGLLSEVGSTRLGGQSGIWVIVPLLFIEPPKRAGRPARRASVI